MGAICGWTRETFDNLNGNVLGCTIVGRIEDWLGLGAEVSFCRTVKYGFCELEHIVVSLFGESNPFGHGCDTFIQRAFAMAGVLVLGLALN